MTDTEALRITKPDQRPLAASPRNSKNHHHHRHHRHRRCCCCCLLATIILTTLLILTAVILAFTVFKPKVPKTQVLSATVSGISPRISFPALKIDLNVTLNLNISVYNPNHASFRHGPGKSQLLYLNNQVGDVDVSPGNIPSRGSEIIECRLVLDVDEIVGSDMGKLINDVMSKQEVVLETRTRVPGRVSFLGIFKKHMVATSDCQITVKVPAMTISQQVCRNKNKL